MNELERGITITTTLDQQRNASPSTLFVGRLSFVCVEVSERGHSTRTTRSKLLYWSMTRLNDRLRQQTTPTPTRPLTS